MSKWRPLSRRDDETYDSLYEGVPVWLVASLLDFVVARVSYVSGRARHLDREKLQEIERKLQVPLDWTGGPETALTSIRRNVDDRAYFLDLIDLLLDGMQLTTQHAVTIANGLESKLEEAGSAWRVEITDEGHFRLARRVDATVTAAARAVMSASGRAGQHLAKAWAEAYGRDPDPSSAYREAVRAVEAIAGPIILPKDPKATLGMMIAAMRDSPAKWQSALHPSDGDAVSIIKDTMRLLWTSQLDRHGTADETAPLHVSLDEAQAAVHLAATLVQWFQSGVINLKAHET